MDDNRFDEHIKRKLGNYEVADFDPAALASLHHQMEANASLPWYVKYKTELLVGTGFVLSTLIILFGYQHITNRYHELLKEELKTYHEQIANLGHELERLKGMPADTIEITDTRKQNSLLNTWLLHRVTQLESEVARLKKNQSLFFQDNPSVNLYNIDAVDDEPIPQSIHNKIVPRASEKESARALANNKSHESRYTQVALSTKTIRSIEKHYQKGVGIRLGPTVDFTKGVYPDGEGQFNLGYGLLGDFIFSPSLAIETGFKYAKRYYEIDDLNALHRVQLPNIDERSGDLQKAEMDYWLLEMPVNLKYRYPVSLKTHWIGGVGYSAVLYLRQIFEYDYLFSGDGTDDFTISSIYETNEKTLSPGMLNFSLGVSHQLKNKKILETSLYYQQGFGEMGIEKIKPCFFGIRGVYWFPVR